MRGLTLLALLVLLETGVVRSRPVPWKGRIEKKNGLLLHADQAGYFSNSNAFKSK